MSHLGRQFEQLRMFLPVQEIIDEVHKGDYGAVRGETPRQQWEEPGGHWPVSVRDDKLGESMDRDAREGHVEFHERRVREDLPRKYRTGRTGEWGISGPPIITFLPNGERELSDGHHYLAFHEKLGRTYMPVQYEE